MSIKTIRRIIGAIVFLGTAIVLFTTVQASVSFWDPGEISAASYSLMVPHPPGGPFWLMIGRIFSMIPFAHNIGFRINTVSVLSGIFTIFLLYLIIIKVIENYRGKDYKNKFDAVITYISAATGALAFAFCDTFWFNATESNYLYRINGLSHWSFVGCASYECFGNFYFCICRYNEKVCNR